MIRFFTADFRLRSEFKRVKEANEYFKCKHHGIYKAIATSTRFRGMHVINTEKKREVVIFLMKKLDFLVKYTDNEKAISILKITIDQFKKN